MNGDLVGWGAIVGWDAIPAFQPLMLGFHPSLRSIPAYEASQPTTRRETVMEAVGMGFSLDIKELRFDQDDAFAHNGYELVIPQLPNTLVVIKDCQNFAGFRASVARERILGEVTCFSFHAL